LECGHETNENDASPARSHHRGSGAGRGASDRERLRGNPIMLEMSFTVENMINTIAKTTLAETGQFWRYDGVPEKW
jgi:hypothetical protein